MANTLKEIMAELLTEYEKFPDVPVEDLLKKKLEEKGIPGAYEKLSKALSYIDRVSDNTQSVQDARKNGWDRATWLKHELNATLEGKTDEEKQTVADSISQAMKNVENKAYTEE